MIQIDENNDKIKDGDIIYIETNDDKQKIYDKKFKISCKASTSNTTTKKLLTRKTNRQCSPNKNVNQQKNPKKVKKEHIRKKIITFSFKFLMRFLNKKITEINKTRNVNDKINEIKQIVGDQAKKMNIKQFKELLNKNIKQFLSVKISKKGKKFKTEEENLNYHRIIFEEIDYLNNDLTKLCNTSLYKILGYCSKKLPIDKEIFKDLKTEYDEMIKKEIKTDLKYKNCFEEYLENIDSILGKIEIEDENNIENLTSGSETINHSANSNENNNNEYDSGPSPTPIDYKLNDESSNEFSLK